MSARKVIASLIRFVAPISFIAGVLVFVEPASANDTDHSVDNRLAAKGPQWVPTKPMATSRYGHTATLLPNGEVLVTGGFGGKRSGSVLASSELYNPVSQRWLKTGSMAAPRIGAKAALLSDGRVLVAGGLSVKSYTVSSGQVTGLSFDGVTSAEAYTPGPGTWSTVGSMAVGRLHHTLTVLGDGRVLVAGGQSASRDALRRDVFSSAELFDPVKDRWTTTKSMAVGRVCHTATLLPNGKVLVAGGKSSGADTVTSSAELYDPVKGIWSQAANMKVARCDHTATLLPGGKVLVAGGKNGKAPDDMFSQTPAPYLDSAELYDPIANQWSSTGDMNGARSGHTAILLANGSVLAVRGQNNRSINLDSAEIYDPAKGAWNATTPMNRAVGKGLTLSLLPDGKVLATGGDRGYIESKPGFRERLARGIYREDDFNENSALSSAELLTY